MTDKSLTDAVLRSHATNEVRLQVIYAVEFLGKPYAVGAEFFGKSTSTVDR
jgi:hypothetical protein